MLTADPPTGDVGEDAGLESRGVADVVSDKLEQSLPVAANNGRSCSPALATRVTPGGLAGAAEGEHNNPNSDSAAAGNAHIAGLGPSEEPISANLNARDSAPMVKKPRKKAVSFDDTARIRFLRYRTEKRQQHAEIQSSMTIKALFDRVAEEFCGTLFPEYDFSGSELSNLERSLRRTFVAYDEKGYDSDKTVKLAGKAPPKDDLWIAMKELFRIEGQKSGSLVDDRPQAPKRDDLSKISTVLQQHNSSTGIESTVLANLPEPSGRAMDLDIEAHEEIAESDEETRWTYRRGDYVDESEDDERIRVQTDLEKRQRWKSVIGAARFGADATTVGRTITNAAKGCAPVGEDKAEPGAVGKGIRPSRGQGPMDRAGTLPSKGTSVSTKLKDAAQADPGGRIKDHFKSPNTNRIPLSKVLVESSDLEDENELLTKVQLVVSTDKNVLKDEAEGIQHQAAADPVKEGVDAEGSLAGQTLPVAKKRGRPRKKLPEGHVEPKTVRASKNAAQAGNEDPKQGDLQDLAEKSTKRRRRALDEPREPKPKRPRAPRKIKSKSAEPAIVISDTEREMATEPPKYRGPFLTDFPTRSVHFLRVTSQHLMQVILYLRKKNLDAWWSEERFQEVMLSLRCELAAKLEKEFKAKTKGLADIHRSGWFRCRSSAV